MNAMLPSAATLSSPDDAERQFYDALRRGDIEQLMAVWADEDDIVCVHPGGARLIGPGPIRATFDRLFSEGTIEVQAQRLRRVLTHGSAVHSVLERINVYTGGKPQTAFVISTNVYVKAAEGWRLVAHHASRGSGREFADTAEVPALLH